MAQFNLGPDLGPILERIAALEARMALLETNLAPSEDKRVEIPGNLATKSFMERWVEFKRYRAKELKKPMSIAAERRMLAKLGKHDVASVIAALEDAMANGYQGVFPKGGTGEVVRHKGAARNDINDLLRNQWGEDEMEVVE